MNKKEFDCCPKFDPKPWDGKVFEWNKKKFIKDSVFTLFYVPMNFGSVIKRMMGKVARIKGNTPDWMGLSYHRSKWKMDLLLAVDKIIPKANNITLSGKFLSKVYEGPFKDTGKWMKNFNINARKKGFKVLKQFMWYTTCPKCAKKYNKNYVVVIAAVKELEPAKKVVKTQSKAKSKKVTTKKVVSKKKAAAKKVVSKKKASTKKVVTKKKQAVKKVSSKNKPKTSSKKAVKKTTSRKVAKKK